MQRARIFATVAILGVLYMGLTTLILHLQPTGYDPVHNVVSDYAVGQFGTEMALAFFIGGAGVVALSLALVMTSSRRVSRIGGYLLLVTGISLILVGAFPTDLEGAALTLHGTIHSLLSLFVFTLGPLGMTFVSYGRSRRWFLATISGFIATSIFAVAIQLSIGAAGLAERGIIFLLLTWWFLVSLHMLRLPERNSRIVIV